MEICTQVPTLTDLSGLLHHSHPRSSSIATTIYRPTSCDPTEQNPYKDTQLTRKHDLRRPANP